jgi:hypothetical protein
MAPASWHLFIDEAGAFDGNSSLVAGLLLRGADDAELRARLRNWIDHPFPDVAYPPHAADFLGPSALLVAVARGGLPPADPAISEALQILQSAKGVPCVASFWRMVASTRPPNFAECEAVAGWLATQSPQLATTIARVAQARARALSAPLFALADTDAVLVASALGAGDLDYAEDPYLATLRRLLQRVAVAVDVPHEHTLVTIHAESRHVGLERRPLQLHDLTAAAEAAVVDVGRPRVLFFGGSVQFKGPELHPGLVFADFLATMTRASLRIAQGGRLAALLREVDDRTGASLSARVPCVGGNPVLPTISSDATAPYVAGLVRGALAALPAPVARWETEEAAMWRDAIAQGGVLP